MGTNQTWRKAYGALKDQTKVGLAQLNSDFKNVDVAIVKATNHVECPPKERHVRKILFATSAARPRADVAYCIHALSRRLAKTHNWTVALKTLIVIHRTLREGDPTFREEILNFQQRGRILQLSNFKDDSSPIAWDCSAWVRTYGLFLEERLECFRILKYDIESERIPKPGHGQDKGYSRTREVECEQLLDHLPALQQLLYRLIGCRPEGAAVHNYVIQYALALVLKESFKIYCAINDGIINLIDKFFEMPRHEAIKSLDIYKRAGQQASNLSDFYEVCKGLELARNFQFPALKEPPQSFLATMEEYIKEAPSMVSVSRETLEYPERLMLTYKPEEETETLEVEEETKRNEADEEKWAPLEDDFVPRSDEIHVTSSTIPQSNDWDSHDLLGLNNNNTTNASTIEDNNALALAIVSTGTTVESSNVPRTSTFDPTGWELALVDVPGNNISSVQDRQWGGGLDSLTLDSLYEEGAYRASQQPTYGKVVGPTQTQGPPNPFSHQEDPFAMSNNIAPPHSVQMADHSHSHYQSNPFSSTFQQNNPFMDNTGYGSFPNHNNHQQMNNPFGTTTLI